MKQKVLVTKEIIKDLKKKKKVFRVLYSSLTTTIFYNGREYFFANHSLPLSELYFLKMVQDNVDINKLPKVNKHEIIFTHTEILKRNLNQTFKGYEIDLTAAFWNFAHKPNNFISDKIHEKGFSVGKKTRLAALGACAKKTFLFEFDGNKFNKIEEKTNPKENVFFKVAKDTSEVMKNLAYIADVDYLFFWCDAIFFTGEEKKNLIENYLKENGFEFKTFPTTIRINKLSTTVYRKEKKPRKFFHEINKEELQILENKI